MKKVTLLFLFTVIIITNAFARMPVIYVKPTGNDANDGLTWGNAKQTLQAALGAASSGNRIWVAAGTYIPSNRLDAGDPRTLCFQMIDGVEIYGGFAGTESSELERVNYGAGEANETILTGEFQGDADNTNNCYHVIYSNGVSSTAMLDGFSITGGYANGGSSHYDNGGGMFNNNSNPIIHDCTFINNTSTWGGGGICNNGSSPYITNCTFNGNHDGYSGGAICNQLSSYPTIEGCFFLNNTATLHAGAVLNYYSHATLTNCKFFNNSCGSSGGAVQNYGNASDGSSPTLTNCLFYANAAAYGGAIQNTIDGTPLIINCTFSKNYVSNTGNGGAIYNAAGTNPAYPTVKNCIFWGDYKLSVAGPNVISEITGGNFALFTYCCIQGENSTSFSGSGNIFSDPLFVNPVLDDFSLQDESPCIGAGVAGLDIPTYDIAYVVRGTVPDMGAFENARETPLPVELTSFTAGIVSNGVELKWQTATEQNNYGFEIERNTPLNPLSRGDERGVWETIGFVNGSGNSNSPKEYSFIDTNPIQGNAQYRLKQIDLDGNYKYYSQTAEVSFSPTDVKENLVPKEFGLSQNYPNPFNPSTVISYQLPVSGNITLKVYDMLGKEVAALVNDNRAPGEYRVEFDGRNLSSGIYYYQLRCGNFVDTKKFILMK